MALAVTGIAEGCASDDPTPTELMDGSSPPELKVELEGVASPVLTKARTIPVGEIETGSSADTCLRGRAATARPTAPLVERIGVKNESITLRGALGIHGCDNSPGPREERRRWCGSAFGMLDAGRLRDPRLSIGCKDDDGNPIGFVWAEPARMARYVTVEQRGYGEVYEVAGNLPVRIATATDVSVEMSRAAFEISEHDASGRRLRRYRLEAVVAG